MKKCNKTNAETYVALLQIRATQLEPGLPSPVTLLFNCSIQGIMPIINRLPINSDNDDVHFEALVNRKAKTDEKYGPARNYDLFLIGSTVVVPKSGCA